MSQENVEIVRRSIEAWNERDPTPALASNTAHFRGREGIEVIARSTFSYTVENGQITRLRVFQERAEALQAAGLSE